MEIPERIRGLYRHWDMYLKREGLVPLETVTKNTTLRMDIERFIHERITIWQKKTTGELPPYTKDEVMAKYRFCNIMREFDRQTIEFHTILTPLRDDFALWLMNMFYARMVARTATIEGVGLLSFDTKENKEFYTRLMNSSRPRYGTPYVFPISTILKSDTPTREEFIAYFLPVVMKDVAAEISTWNKKSVYDGVERVLQLFGYNLQFLWTEVLIDVAYQYPEYIDLFGRFPIGPGSAPTMKRINPSADPSLLVEDLARTNFVTDLEINGSPICLSAENWEGVGCEFRKYTNLKEGKGRKRIFTHG